MKTGSRYAAMSLLQSLLASAHSDLGSRLMERAEEKATSQSIQPVSVGASQIWDGADGIWSSFAVQIGTAAQNVRLFPSTMSFDTVVIPADGGCPQPGAPSDCSNARGGLFDSSRSLSWNPNSNYSIGIEDNIGYDTTGIFGFDTVTLGYQGSGDPTVNHSIIAEVAPYQYYLGLLGLNPRPTNFTGFNDPQPSLLELLKNTSQIPSLSYGYTAGAKYQQDGVFGSLTLGGYDAARMTSQNFTTNMQQNDNFELVVAIQSISTSTSNNQLLPGGSIYALIDSTFPYIWLPEEACTAFENEFGLVWNDTEQLYFVNDSLHQTLLQQNPTVTFNIAANNSGPATAISLPYAAFDQNISYPIIDSNTSMRYFPLARATNNTQYILGRTFLQEAYLFANYEDNTITVAPCVWNSNTQTPNIQSVQASTSSSSSNPSSSSGISGGAIAGIIIAVVLLLVLAAFLVWWFVFRKRRATKRKAELDALDTELRPGDNLSHADAAHKFGSGGELEDNAVHEMHANAQHTELDGKSPSYGQQAQGYFHGKPGLGRSYSEMEGHTHSEMEGNTPVYEMPGNTQYAELESPARMPQEKK